MALAPRAKKKDETSIVGINRPYCSGVVEQFLQAFCQIILLFISYS
jgi:hypothetical protein